MSRTLAWLAAFIVVGAYVLLMLAPAWGGDGDNPHASRAGQHVAQHHLSGNFQAQLVAPQFGDYGFGHAEFHNFYNNGERREDGSMGPLMRNHQPNIKCCEGDCRPVKAKHDGAQWWVFVDGGWEPVPEERIKVNVRTPNRVGHVCASRRYPNVRPEIFCFVEPELEN